MIHLTASQHGTLRQVCEAGAEGVPFAALNLGDALSLALDELVRPVKAEQRVYVTEKGEAFLNRVTA